MVQFETKLHRLRDLFDCIHLFYCHPKLINQLFISESKLNTVTLMWIRCKNGFNLRWKQGSNNRVLQTVANWMENFYFRSTFEHLVTDSINCIEIIRSVHRNRFSSPKFDRKCTNFETHFNSLKLSKHETDGLNYSVSLICFISVSTN